MPVYTATLFSMAEHINPFINFRDGMKGVPAFFGGDTRNLLNVDVDDNGFLELRKGTQVDNSRLFGTYPRVIRRTHVRSINRTTEKDQINFSNDTLTIGLADRQSLLTALDGETELRVISGKRSVAVRVFGRTRTIVNERTKVLTFSMRLVAGGSQTFRDGEEVYVVILKSDDERETYLENDNRLKYSEGDQFFVAHYLGDTPDEAVTRYYKFPKNTHAVPIRKGRILLLADGENQHFIDVLNNRQYDWDLTPPLLTQAKPRRILPEFTNLMNYLITQYRANPSLDVFRNFPFDKVVGIDLAIIGWKFTYEDPDLAISTKASKSVYIELESPTVALLSWLYSGPISVGDPVVTHDHVYLGLQHLDIIDGGDVSTIEAQSRQRPEFVFDTENRPDWATHIGSYSTPIPRSFYRTITSDLSTADENATAWEVQTTAIGTGLIATGAIVASSVFVVTGVPFVIIGLIALSIGDDDDTRQYKVDIDAVEQITDEEYLRYELHRLPLDPVDAYTYALPAARETDVVYLDAFYNESPPEKLDAITLHAGRIYGVNRETEEIVFSHIDGVGNNNYFAFPLSNALPTAASGISPVETIEQMPNRGGLYVFKRDSIHYIDGQNIFSGLYDINVSAQTDISAADYKKNVGCISARSVKNDGSMVLFVGSDGQIYSLSGKTAQPIGVDVKPIIQDLEIDDLQDIVTEWYNERFYLTLPNKTLILNTERKYWTSFDWILKDILWSRGGRNAESIFYGLTEFDDLVQLMVDNPDEVFPVMWEANTLIRRTCSLLTGVYVYTDRRERVIVTVEGNEPPKTQRKVFRPTLGNKYRVGCHVKGRNMEIKVETEKPVMIDRIELEENY